MLNYLIRKTYISVPIIFVVAFIFSYFFKGNGLSEDLNILLSIASFIFGFYIALAVSRAKERQDEVRRQLRIADGLLINCKIQMEIFDKESQDAFLKVVDDYLVTSIDYKLVDMDKSSDEFYAILNFVIKELKPKNAEQIDAKKNIIDSLGNLSKERSLLEISTKNRITKFEWILILGLFSVILYFIFNLKISGLLGELIMATLVSSLSMIVIVLHRYNNLSWQEDVWIWEPLTRTFIQLGLMPYYVDFVTKQKRARLPKEIDYRIAHYPSPYPVFDDKVVEIIKAQKNN